MKPGDWVILNRDIEGYKEGDLGQIKPNPKVEGVTFHKRVRMDRWAGILLIRNEDVTVIDSNVADIMRIS